MDIGQFRYAFSLCYLLFSIVGFTKYTIYKSKVHFWFLLLNLVITIRFFLKMYLPDILSLENENTVKQILYISFGYLQPIFYYILIIRLFKLHYEHSAYKIILLAIFIWSLFAVLDVCISNNSLGKRHLYLYMSIFEFLVLLFIVLYSIKADDSKYKFTFLGSLCLLTSVTQILVFHFFKSIDIILFTKLQNYIFIHLSILGDGLFFYLRIAHDEKKLLVIKNKLEIQQEKTIKELETTKKLVLNKSIVLKDKTQINLEKLIYIKADDHYLNVITKDDKKSHLVRGKLTEIAKELPSNFIKCHRSYIINMNYITKIQNNSIIMSDKSEIPISRAFKLETKA